MTATINFVIYSKLGGWLSTVVTTLAFL